MRGIPGRVSDQDYELLASFRYALRRFLHFSEAAARRAGVTPQQHQALLAVKGFGKGRSFTVGELAEKLQVQHHSAVGLVNRLVALRLARRVKSQTDARQVCLELTAKGEQMLQMLSTSHREQLRSMRPEMEAVIARLGQQ
jgi:DNA-binding MarR family transcriptional regulator